MEQRIVFIGGGNMATSLISGLHGAGWNGAQIRVIDPNADKRDMLVERYQVQAFAKATADALNADALVLAMKPQAMPAAAAELRPLLDNTTPLIISIAAGVPMDALSRLLGNKLAYVRAMPNTPSLIGAGATGLYAQDSVGADQRELAEQIMATAGVVQWVDSEAMIDTIIATSGSGPAYFFAVMEAMQAAAIDMGLTETKARELVLQTALGAARMAMESGDDPATLRRKVTSPGGTTERALAYFSDGDLNGLVAGAMQAAADRARSMADEFSQNLDPDAGRA